MKFGYITASLLLTSLVGACTSSSGQPSVSYDKHTQVLQIESSTTFGYGSAAAILSDFVTVKGSINSSRGRTPTYSIYYYAINQGSWPFLDSAYMYGTRLKVQPGGGGANCNNVTSGCRMAEWGNVILSEAMFRKAAKTGMEFKLSGKGRSYVVQAPANIFAEALELQNSM